MLIKKDKTDKRKQMISLSGKATRMLPQLERIWRSCEKAILTVLAGDLAVLKYLDHIDAALSSTSFHNRFKQEYLQSQRS